jgi:hypothetical protein
MSASVRTRRGACSGRHGGCSVVGFGVAALRGEAHDLSMVLWRRSPLDVITVFGAAELAAAFVEPPSDDWVEVRATIPPPREFRWPLLVATTH